MGLVVAAGVEGEVAEDFAGDGVDDGDLEVLDEQWATRDELRIAIVTWIERTYHRRRRQDALGRLTPIEFETIMTTPASQAA